MLSNRLFQQQISSLYGIRCELVNKLSWAVNEKKYIKKNKKIKTNHHFWLAGP